MIGELAQEGLAIIFISSELPEVLGLSDRIVVMSEGRVVAILDRAEASPKLIMRHASHVSSHRRRISGRPCRPRRSPAVCICRPAGSGSSEACCNTRG